MAKLFGLTARQQERLGRVAEAVERQPLASVGATRLGHRRPSSPQIILAKITGNVAGNDYSAKSIRGAAPDTADYADTDFGDTLSDDDDIIARDRAQVGGSTPRPLTGLIIAGKVIGRTDDGKRIVEFASAVQKLRIHGDQLQATYLPNPAGDSDWVDMVEGYDCDE